MEKQVNKFYFTVVYDERGEYKAAMSEDFINGHRYLYVMDQSGQHEFVHENYIYKYKNIGNAIAYNDAHVILRLLDELNEERSPCSDKLYVWAFNEISSEKKSLIDFQWLNDHGSL